MTPHLIYCTVAVEVLLRNAPRRKCLGNFYFLFFLLNAYERIHARDAFLSAILTKPQTDIQISEGVFF